MKALDEAVSSHKAAAGQAMDDIQRLVAAQQEAAAREQSLRTELAEARADASLANGRRSLAEDRCLWLADEAKAACEQRDAAQAEQVALKVNNHFVLVRQKALFAHSWRQEWSIGGTRYKLLNNIPCQATVFAVIERLQLSSLQSTRPFDLLHVWGQGNSQSTAAAASWCCVSPAYMTPSSWSWAAF